MKPFFTYYGGKYRIAPHYPAPKYPTIIEPFAGSAGYALRHHKSNVLLFDANPKVCAVWQYLISVSEKEILSLPEKFEDVRQLDICDAAKWLIGFWLNKGCVSPCNVPSAWMREGTRPNSFWGRVIKERIAAQVDSIRHWKCEQIDFLTLQNREATWFVDPPYFGKAGSLYIHSDLDYDLLGMWCETRQGQVIVCEMEGANWLPFSEFRTAKSTEGKRGKKQCKEVIWTL